MTILDRFYPLVLKGIRVRLENWEIDEIRSYYYWDMLNAIQSYNPLSPAAFSTYIYKRASHHPAIYFQVKRNSAWNRRKVLIDRESEFEYE